MKTNRIEWLDSSRAMAIILIVVSHILVRMQHFDVVFKIISAFHVPIFFMISGYFFNRKKTFRVFLKSNFKSYMIPYFTFAFLYLIPYFLFKDNIAANLNVRSNNAFLLSIIKIFLGNGHNYALQQNSSLWFLPCFFVTKIILYFLYKNFDKYEVTKKNILIISCLIAFLGYLNMFKPFRLPWGIDIAIIMIPFMLIGKLIISKINSNSSKWIYFLCLFIGLVFALENGNVECMNFHFGNYLFFIISAFTLSISFLGLVKYVLNCRTFQYIGKHTISILVFHKIIVLIFQTKLGVLSEQLLYGIQPIQILLLIITLITSILLSIGLGLILEKFTPSILGIGGGKPDD